LPAPTCSVWADTNPLGYGNSTTLHWTSENANTSFYVNTIGYVTANTSGSATVGPSETTNYDGTAIGSGITTECEFTLSVNPPPTPTCSITVDPTEIIEGQNTTLEWSSTNATSCEGDNFETDGETDGSVSVAPSGSTTYIATCSGDGGSVQCSGTGENGIGAEIEVSAQCEELVSYTCDGDTIIETEMSIYCEETETEIDTCEAPEFCSAGVGSCITPNATGWITASPRLVGLSGTSVISWEVGDAESCTVSGNGQTWTGTSGSHASSPITILTTYTLVCDDADLDGDEDDLTDSVTILRVPGFREL